MMSYHPVCDTLPWYPYGRYTVSLFRGRQSWRHLIVGPQPHILSKVKILLLIDSKYQNLQVSNSWICVSSFKFCVLSKCGKVTGLNVRRQSLECVCDQCLERKPHSILTHDAVIRTMRSGLSMGNLKKCKPKWNGSIGNSSQYVDTSRTWLST